VKKIDLKTLLLTALVTALFIGLVRAVGSKLPAPLSSVASFV
jgi:hypothetical protein